MQTPLDVLVRDAGLGRCLGDAPKAGPVRRGITLIELLVVVTVLMLLAAIAVPAVRPALEGRRIREAARAINVYISSAQSEAMLTGRPCGVILERVEGLPQCSMVLQQAIVPPPYAGDDLNSAVRLQRVGSSQRFYAYLVGGFNANLVSVGDRMQINAQGPSYGIRGFDLTNPLGPRLVLTGPSRAPWSSSLSAPLPYQIFRRPIKSSAKPLQLPAGAIVDLVASGIAFQQLGWHETNPPTLSADPGYQAPVMIMFSPNGSVERMVYMQYNRNARPGDPLFWSYSDLVTGPIHLLVGKRERVTTERATSATPEEDMPNWTDLTNLWITINPQTGLVSTAENHFVDLRDTNKTIDNGNPINWSKPTSVSKYINAARAAARGPESMGGR